MAGERLAVLEGDTEREFDSYLELLDWAVRRTYEICVNSPEEYDDLTEEERDVLDKIHELWI